MPEKTLEDYAGNGDGTYHARGLVQFLMSTFAGKEISDEEAQAIVNEGVQKAKDRKGV